MAIYTSADEAKLWCERLSCRWSSPLIISHTSIPLIHILCSDLLLLLSLSLKSIVFIWNAATCVSLTVLFSSLSEEIKFCCRSCFFMCKLCVPRSKKPAVPQHKRFGSDRPVSCPDRLLHLQVGCVLLGSVSADRSEL